MDAYDKRRSLLLGENSRMSLKYYGIYLLYPPNLDLRAHGLGRYLAAFLKGADARDDVRFVIVCPSWSKKDIQQLCESEGVSQANFDVQSPTGQNVLLAWHEAYRQYKTRQKSNKKYVKMRQFIYYLLALEQKMYRNIVPSRTLLGLLSRVVCVTPFFLLRFIVMIGFFIKNQFKKFFVFLNTKIITKLQRPKQWLHTAMFNPKNNVVLVDYFNTIQNHEIELMITLINKMTHVAAWYAPTSFWPSFNAIKAPRLMCVPDVVLADFPVGFSRVGGDRFLKTFHNVEKAIQGGSHFVTYSNHIKEHQLMARYGVSAECISVIPHASNRLDQWINIHGSLNNDEATVHYARQQLMSALNKATNGHYTRLLQNNKLQFIFYASQFRPSKNILTLLRAYEFLFKKRYIPHKLILTGSMGTPEIDAFIREHHLEKESLLLPGLSLKELASCYKLADMVVNPSFSEGGCPFTLTEALSVNTPVIMANIPVTLEVITDVQLQNMMLFDPYCWRHLANRLEWALSNKSTLLDAQHKLYLKLKKRTWCKVVDETIHALDKTVLTQAASQT